MEQQFSGCSSPLYVILLLSSSILVLATPLLGLRFILFCLSPFSTMVPPVTRAIRLMSTMHSTVTTARVESNGLLRSTIFSAKHFPTFLGALSLSSGIAGFYTMDQMLHAEVSSDDGRITSLIELIHSLDCVTGFSDKCDFSPSFFCRINERLLNTIVPFT